MGSGTVRCRVSGIGSKVQGQKYGVEDMELGLGHRVYGSGFRACRPRGVWVRLLEVPWNSVSTYISAFKAG